VANHPGGADVVATISAISQKRPDHVILANELICVEPVVGIVLPVNTMATKNKVNMDEVHQAYRDGKVVVFYAAGKNSRHNENGELRDRKWRPTFLDFALKYNTPITVLQISGSNANIFYKVSEFRETRPRFKKIPLENIFQLRELVKPKKEPISLLFSEPITAEQVNKRLSSGEQKDKHEFANELYDFLYAMDEENLKFDK
jgi:putative hemolysin